MGFAIPKIEYKNVVTTGSFTGGEADLTGVSFTEDIEVGMFVRGAGIPLGATVGAVVDDVVTLAGSMVTDADGADVALDFGYAIEFDFPPKETDGESIEVNQNQLISLSGQRQVSTNFVEANRKPVFSFVSPAIFVLLKSFLDNFAVYGNSFRYYEDKTLNSFVEYELDALKYTPKKLAPKGVDVYVWEIPLTFRRVL